MYEFQPEETFEPSSGTKEWALYTHKTEHSFAGVSLPGLFQTTYYEWQIIGFIGIFLLEGVATYWCFKEGVIITAILASIFVDVVLAVTAHVFQKDICRIKNELVYEEDLQAGVRKRRLKRKVLWQTFFYILILISAMFKVYWFFSVYRIPDATTLFVTVCYVVGGVLHIICTGYAVFTFIFNRKINGEHTRFVESNGKSFSFDPTKPLRHPIGSPKLIEVPDGRQRITKEGDGNYYFYTQGVLTDSKLRELIARQDTPDQRATVAREGVKHQITILKQSPEGRPKK